MAAAARAEPALPALTLEEATAWQRLGGCDVPNGLWSCHQMPPAPASWSRPAGGQTGRGWTAWGLMRQPQGRV